MQAVKIVLLCISWPSLTPVNLSWGGVNRSLDMQGLRNLGAWVMKSCFTNTCLSLFLTLIIMYVTYFK